MICTTIQKEDPEEVIKAVSRCEMAEIRLDSCDMGPERVQECFSMDVPLVATCRIASLMEKNPAMTEAAAVRTSEDRLIRAIIAGARYADVEIEAPKQMVKRVALAARENGTVLIRSYHNFKCTDSSDDLKSIVEKCLYHDGEIAKIVTMAVSDEDADRILSLYDSFDPSKLVAFCMGGHGRDSRLECLKKGAPFTYAALDGDPPAAPGQWSDREMYRAVYGGRRFVGYPDAGMCVSDRPCRQIRVPSSKSFAQRAIIAAALCDGMSHLRHYSDCGDNAAAIAVARSLGADVSIDGDTLVIKGAGTERAGSLVGASGMLHVGESGLLARLMMPLVSVLSPVPVTLTGEKTLSGRILSGVDGIMERFGVKISGQDGLCRVPLRIDGRLVPCRTDFSGTDGSQIISGLLMALPLAGKNSSFTVHDPVSIPYMFITVDILKKFGIKISDELLGGDDFMLSSGSWDFCSDIVFKIKGGQRYTPADLDLEGDWSTAANFLVAGAVFGRAELSGLDTGSIQADLSIMDILMDAGAGLSQYDGNDGNIAVQRAPLRSFTTDASQCPDLFPIISVLAAFCQGTSRISGVRRLSHKESDRGKAILEMLSRMGVNAAIEEDTLIIEGHSLDSMILTGTLLKGGFYRTCHDHRMAMALSVASLGADSPIEIDDRDCVAKSCPMFFDLFKSFVS